MEQIVLVIHIVAAIGVIGLVLIQHGKGADAGAAFGGGTSGSLFGVSGSSNLLSRATALFVVIFFSTSLSLAYMASHKDSGSVINTQTIADEVAVEVEKEAAPASITDDIPK
jgi:preprotein translocase subunit SecG